MQIIKKYIKEKISHIYYSIILYSYFFKTNSAVIWADNKTSKTEQFYNNTAVIELFNSYLIYIAITFSIFCFFNLIVAKTPVNALTSFFGLLLSLVFFFFSVKADYAGAVILMVYLGAIVIFFCFILLTTDPKKFASFKKEQGFTLSFFIFAFIHFMLFIYVCAPTIAEIGSIPN